MTNFSTVANAYAEALFVISQKDNTLQRWIYFLEDFSLLMSNDVVVQFVEHPGLEKSVKIDLLLELMSVGIDEEVNFINLLLEKKRISIVSHVLASLKEMKNKRDGVFSALFITAFPVSEDQVDKMLLASEMIFKSKLKPQFLIDKSLIGGFKIIVGDRVLDASIKNQINKMQETLLIV